MSLLPRKVTDFAESDYWESFFKKRGDNPFEWYGDFKTIESVLLKYLKANDRILQVGCGNSKLAEELCDAGYPNVTSFDVVPDVIAEHVRNRSQLQSNLEYVVCDATDEIAMTRMFPDSSFNVIVDKGTLDALLPDDSTETLKRCGQMLSQILRILSVGGRYIVVSLAQRHVLQFWLETVASKTDFTYLQRICLVDSPGGLKFKCPVFLMIVTKLKPMPNMKMAFEFSPKSGVIQKYLEISSVLGAVADAQSYSLVRYDIQSGKLQAEVSLTLYSDVSSETPRYEVSVVDTTSCKQTYAVFIVPQGREHEWMFGTPEGRLSLANSAGYERLTVVRLCRNQDYVSLDNVKEELSAVAMDFAPTYKGKPNNVPYLSLGEDIGQRKTIFRGHSDISGDFVVEDVATGGKNVSRRLVFLQSQNCFQSEARLIVRKNQLPVVDHAVLLSEYSKMMLASFAFCDKFMRDEGGPTLKTCIVGLGGGCLPMFIRQVMSKGSLVCVELDPEVLTVAEKFFDFKVGHGVSVHVRDGVKFLEENSGFDVVIIDAAGSKSDVVTCPPMSFLEKSFLLTQRKALEMSKVWLISGVLAFNVVTRSEPAREKILRNLTEVFPFVRHCRCEDDVNQVVFCAAEPPQKFAGVATLKKCEAMLNRNLKRPDSKIKFAELIAGLKEAHLAEMSPDTNGVD